MLVDIATAQQKLSEAKDNHSLRIELFHHVLVIMVFTSERGTDRREVFDFNNFMKEFADIDFEMKGYTPKEIGKVMQILGELLESGLATLSSETKKAIN